MEMSWRRARHAAKDVAQAFASPQRHVRSVLQPQPQAAWLAGAAWQPQVQVAPAQLAQRQAKVSVVFMSCPRWVGVRMIDPWRHCPAPPYRSLESKG